ncbi:translocase of chloroplast 90, chloroplastic [Dorcoceras hygrometricum]|uniref:Translocase of chloroplast 90, chloroplastic n=1 Tax=Dorcoceras hygrometricum TaxID=472368 RepID=A0A2Z7AC46_9LAMI|nr:translocase of chloroplast 90, chloroplastic [Dorcoceras hygrometricum]
MSNVEQEADNSKRNSEKSDVVLKNQQMVRVQQMATVEWIQQKRKDKDCKTTALDLRETTASWTYKEPVVSHTVVAGVHLWSLGVLTAAGCGIGSVHELSCKWVTQTQTTQKQENKYEVKPQYEELSKQLNMQHAINQCYECMRAIKDRIARPASRLAIITIEPLYHAQQVSRWKSSVRDPQDPSAHHNSVVFRHDKSVGHHSDDSVGLFRHDKSVGQSQHGSQSGHQSICQAQYVYKSTKTRNNKKCSPRNSNQRRTTELLCTKTQQLRTSSPTLIQGFKWVAIERATHNEPSATKITQIIGGERWKFKEDMFG